MLVVEDWVVITVDFETKNLCSKIIFQHTAHAQAIGNTPLIRLEKLTGPDSAEVLVKFEGANPTGSMKDRMALSMILGAERSGIAKTW